MLSDKCSQIATIQTLSDIGRALGKIKLAVADNSILQAFASLLGDFRPVPRIFIFLGFVVIVVGSFCGFNLHNRTPLIGTFLLFGGLAGDYWPEVRFTVDSQATYINWGKLFCAVPFTLVAILAAIFAWLSN